VIRLAILAWARLNALFNVARSAVCLGRVLLIIVAIELLTMPITQGLWTWDKFLHGGQDFELGLLVIITCLCLILLRTEQSKRSLGLLVLMRALLFRAPERAAFQLAIAAPSRDRRPRSTSSFPAAALNLPLLI
jgi:hypothetical protein